MDTKRSLHQPLKMSTSTKPLDVVDNDEKVRSFLVYSAVFLVPLPFATYLLSRDISVLATSTIVGFIVVSVYSYYFRRKRY